MLQQINIGPGAQVNCKLTQIVSIYLGLRPKLNCITKGPQGPIIKEINSKLTHRAANIYIGWHSIYIGCGA